MPLLRIKHIESFTVLSNNLINDSRLSFKALGLAVYLFSKPDNWSINIKYLTGKDETGSKRRQEGKEAISTALQELEKCGYLTKKHLRDELGHFKDWEYILSERSAISSPKPENQLLDHPKPDYPEAGNPEAGNPPLINTNLLTNTKINKKDKDLSKKSLDQKKSVDNFVNFEEFWKIYPRQEAKAKAKGCWDKLQPQGEVFSLISLSIDSQKKKRDNQRRRSLYGWSEDWPLAATWLNNKRWLDKIYDPELEKEQAKTERRERIKMELRNERLAKESKNGDARI